jgi:hypothetical protein
MLYSAYARAGSTPIKHSKHPLCYGTVCGYTNHNIAESICICVCVYCVCVCVCECVYVSASVPVRVCVFIRTHLSLCVQHSTCPGTLVCLGEIDRMR